MRSADELSREEMEHVISQIQALLWLDMRGENELWDPDKQWDSETIEYIAGVLDDQGLRPSQSFSGPPVRPDRLIWGNQSGLGSSE
jgi:hypothetical protein